MAWDQAMLEISIPNFGDLHLHYLVLDFNGTIAENGVIDPSLKPFFSRLKTKLDVIVITADTFGTAKAMGQEFGIECHVLKLNKIEAEEKRDFIRQLGPKKVVAMGNGNNDDLMIQEAALGIGVLGAEGISRKTILAADFIVKDPRDAFEMLINPRKLKATLRC